MMISIVDRKIGRGSLLVILGCVVTLLPRALDKTIRCAERSLEDIPTYRWKHIKGGKRKDKNDVNLTFHHA